MLVLVGRQSSVGLLEREKAVRKPRARKCARIRPILCSERIQTGPD